MADRLDMVLTCTDGMADRFCSMSSQIQAERTDYYLQLERAQRGNVDIANRLAWFPGGLGRAINAASQALDVVFSRARLWDRINQRPYVLA